MEALDICSFTIACSLHSRHLHRSIQNIPDWHSKNHKPHHLTRVKTAHVHPATCNLTHWLTRCDSPTVYWCFALPQLLYRWRHQSRIFWMVVVYSIESKPSKVIFFISFRDLPLQVVMCSLANGGGDCCLTRWCVTVVYPKTNELTNLIALGPSWEGSVQETPCLL
jgi:hypothetical protein